MLSGLQLLQIAVDPEESDFLPPRMTLCLAGRGSLALEALPDDLRAALWRFLTMFRNPRVSAVPMIFSSDKKLEIPVGLTLLGDLSPGVPEAPSPDPVLPVRQGKQSFHVGSVQLGQLAVAEQRNDQVGRVEPQALQHLR